MQGNRTIIFRFYSHMYHITKIFFLSAECKYIISNLQFDASVSSPFKMHELQRLSDRHISFRESVSSFTYDDEEEENTHQHHRH